MSFIAVDTRNPLFPSFEIEAAISGYLTHINAGCTRLCLISELHSTVNKIKGIVVPSSPEKMKLIKSANISPKTVVDILRPRFSCVGNESLVPPKTWGSLLISAIDAVCCQVTSWKDVPDEILIFGHDLHMFGDVEDNNEPLQAAIVQFSRHLERALRDVNLRVRIMCVRLSGGISSSSGQHQRIPLILRNMSILLGEMQSRVGLEYIDNNKMHIDFELKSFLARSLPSMRSDLCLPTVECSRASIALVLQGGSLEACDALHEGMRALELVCTLPRTGIDACCVLGRASVVTCDPHLSPPSRATDNLHMFESLVASLLERELLLLLRTRRRAGPYLSGPSTTDKLSGHCLRQEDDASGYWEYWALVPQQQHQQNRAGHRQYQHAGRITEPRCMVLLQVCDEESFLVDAQGAEDTVSRRDGGEEMSPQQQDPAVEEEYREYMEQSLVQIGRLDTYNPLAFPSGRFARADNCPTMGAPRSIGHSTVSGGKDISTSSQVADRATATGKARGHSHMPPQDVRDQSVYGRGYPPQKQQQQQQQQRGPRAVGTLPIKRTSSTTSHEYTPAVSQSSSMRGGAARQHPQHRDEGRGQKRSAENISQSRGGVPSNRREGGKSALKQARGENGAVTESHALAKIQETVNLQEGKEDSNTFPYYEPIDDFE